MLYPDGKGTKVRTKYKAFLPKGRVCTVMNCKFIENTSVRAYLIESEIGELAWYLDRDLENVK